MLPCQSRCSNYRLGCHKSCARWPLIAKENQRREQRKKAYLAYYSQQCDDVVRRCYQTLPYASRR